MRRRETPTSWEAESPKSCRYEVMNVGWKKVILWWVVVIPLLTLMMFVHTWLSYSGLEIILLCFPFAMAACGAAAVVIADYVGEKVRFV